MKIESLPLADLTESTTPVFCDVCMKKNERSKAQSYCTDCRKCLCTKHVQVWMGYLPIEIFLRASLSMWQQFGASDYVYVKKQCCAELCLCRDEINDHCPFITTNDTQLFSVTASH